VPPTTIPFTDGMELGLGVDDLTGAVRSLAAVEFDAPGAAVEDLGMTGNYDTSLVRTAEDLYESLGVSVAADGRYGLFSASAKVDFAESSRFSSTATFLVARAKIDKAFTRARNPRPVADADRLVSDGRMDLFRNRYGDHFIRGVKSGGEFVAVLSITSSEIEVEQQLAIALKAGMDGLAFGGSVSASVSSSIDELRSRSEVRVSLYQRGGSGTQISYTATVEEVLERLRTFAVSVEEHPSAYEVQTAPYDTLVFSGQPTWFDLAHAEEVLEDCMRLRLRLRTLRNDLDAVLTKRTLFEAPPDPGTLSRWHEQVTAQLNALSAHTAEVVRSISAATFFSLELPADLVVPERLRHTSAVVEVYTHGNYADEWEGIPGQRQQLDVGMYSHVQDDLLIGNDTISSLKVPEGMGVRLYEHSWFQGATIDYTSDVAALPPEWNDRASSVAVYRLADGPPSIDYAMGFDFAWARPMMLSIGDYPDLASTVLGGGTLGALLIPRHLGVTLWDQPGFTGATTELFGEHTTLGDWDNRALSMRVSRIL
jgi:hypothetical protein